MSRIFHYQNSIVIVTVNKKYPLEKLIAHFVEKKYNNCTFNGILSLIKAENENAFFRTRHGLEWKLKFYTLYVDAEKTIDVYFIPNSWLPPTVPGSI